MSKPHKDLPAGSQNWAGSVEGQLAKIAELEGIVRRLVNDFGLDYSNPSRGVNTGNVPSVANPVMLKLPSLKDLDIRDAQDGDLLTFDGKRGVWVARRHDTVQLPKVFPEGDPDSYYVPVEVVPDPVAGVWSDTTAYTNHITNPSFESGTAGWQIAQDWQDPTYTYNAAKSIGSAGSARRGSSAMVVTLGPTSNGTSPEPYSYMNWVSMTLPDASSYNYMPISIKAGPLPEGYSMNVHAHIYILNSSGTVVAGQDNDSTDFSGLGDGEWHDFHINDRSFAVPAGGSRKLLLRFGGNFEGAALDGAVVYVDCFGRSTLFDYFDGDSAPLDDMTFSWTGTPHNSTSIATVTQQIQVPETITLGVPFTVNGRGWPSGVSVDVYESDWYAANSTITPDSAGNFTTTLTIPANTDPDVGPVAGPDTIVATQVGVSAYEPFVEVTLV